MYEIINEVRITGNIQGAPELRSRKLEDGKIEYSTRGTLSQVRRTWTDEDGYMRHSYNMYQFRAKGEVAEKICKRFSAGLMVIVTGSLQVSNFRNEYVTYIQVEDIKTIC